MARYSAGVSKASGAAAAWLMGLRCPATADARIWEIHVLAESAVAGTVDLRRITTAGTGAATSTTPVADDVSAAAATVLVDTAFATAVPVATGISIRRYALPATIGQGIIWTFPQGLVVPVSGAVGLFQLSTLAVTYGVTWVFDQ